MGDVSGAGHLSRLGVVLWLTESPIRSLVWGQVLEMEGQVMSGRQPVGLALRS